MYVLFGITVLIISIDAFTTISHYTRLTVTGRDISARNAAILKTADYPEDEIEYLVPFGERQGRLALPQTEQIAQTWEYGGNACAQYYSNKKVNYFYDPKEFVARMNSEGGLFFVENGDLHFLKDVKKKNKLFENIEYTLFRN
jgi:hypothetical protein